MIVEHPEYQHQLELDDTTGLPKAVILGGTQRRIELHDFQMSLTVGGNEVRSATGGIDYQGAYPISSVRRDGEADWFSSLAGDRCSLPIKIGEVAAKLEFLFRRHGADMTFGLVLVGDPSSKLLIRNLTVSTNLHFAPGAWLLNAPGNGVARDMPFGKVTDWTGISAIGGLRGSSAVLHFANRQDCAALWFRHELEVSDIRVKSETENVLSLEINTNFAGDLGRISSAGIDLFDLDLRVPAFQDFPELFQTWLRLSGHTTPRTRQPGLAAPAFTRRKLGFRCSTPITVLSLTRISPR